MWFFLLLAVSEVTDLREPAEASAHPTTPEAIRSRIEALAGHHFERWTREAGLDYPPERVEFRVYKSEREMEIWGAGPSGPLKRIVILSVCAVDDEPGTKLRQGDGKTPEGTYRARALYPSRYPWMWMTLNASEIDRFGTPGVGSAFRLCLDYPTAADRKRSKQKGFSSPGGGICLHGNCVSSGCVSFTNRDFLAVFAFAMHHRAGTPKVRIYPSR
ncbi:MAG: L,D-transpeptidase family protein [Myxococcota bacterium]